MIGQLSKSGTELPGEHVLNRIAALTLGVGLATAALALTLRRMDWAKGLSAGAVLAWLNFRWLRRGIRAIVTTAIEYPQVQSQPQNPTVTSDAEPPIIRTKSAISQIGTYLALLFRYAL